jgi:hypothetical protein
LAANVWIQIEGMKEGAMKKLSKIETMQALSKI